jgi:hypothetical protein
MSEMILLNTDNAMCLARPDSPTVAYLIMSSSMAKTFGEPNLNFYKFKKLMRPVDSLESLAAEIGCDADTLKNTLREYGRGDKDPFGKAVFPALFNDDDALRMWQGYGGGHFVWIG